MKKISMLIAAIAAVALLASCASNTKPAPAGGPAAVHHDTKGEMDAKGELRMK